MKRFTVSISGLLATITVSSCAHMSRHSPDAHHGARLFGNLGEYHRAISTASSEAQRYFNEGMVWHYGFNHDEAFRSFQRATVLDSDCAMAWWGIALCRGPQHNDPQITKPQNEVCISAIRKAIKRINRTSPVERALIKALAQRYDDRWSDNRDELNHRYAARMGEVWRRFPDDSDVGTLYAEAMMIKRPWDLYTANQEPRPETPNIVAVLNRVLELDPSHAGANHYFIHAVEGSRHPEDALLVADRLSDLVPGSGHLLHMPSHIYVLLGRWDRAIDQNIRAMRADELYRTQAADLQIQHRYMAHNAHMLAFAAMMAGNERQALGAAQSLWDNYSEDLPKRVHTAIDPWMGAKYDVLKRFGRWEQILQEQAPPQSLRITNATWHACRAVAFAALKDFTRANEEFEAFRGARVRVPPDAKWKRDSAHDALRIAEYFVAGEIELQKGNMELAIERLTESMRLEDEMTYSQPPRWMLPVRHTLGAVYLTVGRAADAERVYRQDLAKWQNNGWSLYGLARSLEAQGKHVEALSVREQFENSWKSADQKTTTSCKCIPKT